MEQTDNILWLLKQAWYFSLTTVNDAVSEHGVSTAQIGMLRQLATEPGLSGCRLGASAADQPAGRATGPEGARASRTGASGNRTHNTAGYFRPS